MTVTTSAISFVDRIRRKTYSGHEERVGFRTAWAWHVLQDAICCSKKHLRVFGLDAEKASYRPSRRERQNHARGSGGMGRSVNSKGKEFARKLASARRSEVLLKAKRINKRERLRELRRRCRRKRSSNIVSNCSWARSIAI
jgi:hypothetical protein